MKNKILQIMYKLSKGEIKYNLASKQVLDLFAVVWRSEQLVCVSCGVEPEIRDEIICSNCVCDYKSQAN